MKKSVQILILVLLSKVVYSQPDTVRNIEGKIVEIGMLKGGLKEGLWRSYYLNGNIESEGNYQGGLKYGKWNWYHENGNIWSKESYNKDELTRGKFWDKKGRPSKISEFKIEAEYPGGLEAFRKMINDSTRYPKIAVENGIFGKVLIQFKVDTKGQIEDIKILKHIDPSLDQEAIRVVRLSGPWIPGTFHGKPWHSIFIMPIIFSLK